MIDWETTGAEICGNTAWQSLILAALGVIVMRLATRRSAAERVMTARCGLVALALLPLLNGAFLTLPLPTINFPPRPTATPAATPTIAPSLPPTTHPAITTTTTPATATATPATATATPATATATPAPRQIPEPDGDHIAARKEMIRETVLGIGAVWELGTLLLLLRLGYGLTLTRGFRFGLAPISDPRLETVLHQAQRLLHLRRVPEVFVSPATTSPLTIGIFRPVMILPETLSSRLNDLEIHSIVLHELAHIRYRDHWWGVLQRIVTALYWWNPAVYRLGNRHTAAEEERSDNGALLQLRREEYSECLLQLAEKTGRIRRLPAVIGMAAHPGGLRQRIINILAREKNTAINISRHGKATAAAVTVAVIVAVIGIGLQFTGPRPPSTGATAIKLVDCQTPGERWAWEQLPTHNAALGLPLTAAEAKTLRQLNLQLILQFQQCRLVEGQYRSGATSLLSLRECQEKSIRLEQQKMQLLSRYPLSAAMKQYAAGLPTQLRKNVRQQWDLINAEYKFGTIPLSDLFPYRLKIGQLEEETSR
ncbi:MAG: M56 family metallopeptidase [Victivallales bacterium]|nr:M56 family metallopeptidase [Victivallales bacterium]